MIDLPKDYKFVDAYFTNNDKTIVEVIWHDENQELHVEVIEAKDGDKAWERLLEYIAIDDLHEATYKYIKRSEENYKREVMTIAKEQGMILNLETLNTGFCKKLLDTIFIKDENEKTAKESLFAFKLALFEFDAIKNSTDREAKANIRKAVNIIDALEVAIQIIKQS